MNGYRGLTTVMCISEVDNRDTHQEDMVMNMKKTCIMTAGSCPEFKMHDPVMGNPFADLEPMQDEVIFESFRNPP